MAQKINIVWFKRDLRLRDHLPLKKAIESDTPLLLLYIFEPSLMDSAHSDYRHWRFVAESIRDINSKLSQYGQQVEIMQGEVVAVFKNIFEHYDVETIFSHQETGLWLTYQRDLKVKKLLKANNVKWIEYQGNAVIRGLQNRDNWDKKRMEFLAREQQHPDLKRIIPFRIKSELKQPFALKTWDNIAREEHPMQRGGEDYALETLNSFLTERHPGYNKMISKPTESRNTGSRLSVHLAWGNVSVRQVEQARRAAYSESKSKRDLLAFKSRIAWHCHFIQKLESEPEKEWKNIKPAFDEIRNDWNENYYQAWKNGLTGYPLVDACMRCVTETGFLNFRMRSMLVSFLTHHLWLDWREGAKHLARQFLDFEPGIHFSQFQMQAGTTGTNTIRIYNPVKQAIDHDPEAAFIKRWVTELRSLPAALAIEPWKVNAFEEIEFNFRYAVDYSERIVDTQATYRYASKELWRIKKSEKAKKYARQILQKHTRNPDSKQNSRG